METIQFSKSILPHYEEISKWDDDRLKLVYKNLFVLNIDPSTIDDTKEDVDNFLYEVHNEFGKRFQ